MKIIMPTEEQLGAIISGTSSSLNVKLELQSQAIQLKKGFDRLVCLEEIEIEPRPWQAEAALKVLREMQGSAILADEVGLGKTIEAGLILKELITRGLVQSVLVLVPAPLVEQWKQEITEKFAVDLIDIRDKGWEDCSFLISSIPGLVRSEQRKRIISERTFDLLIVDEAHCLKNHATATYKYIYSISKLNTLLMSATPIQNDIRELYNLVNILKPGYLRSRKIFKEEYMIDRYTPKNVQHLKDLLDSVMIRNRRANTLIELPRRSVQSIEIELSGIEREFHNRVIDFCRLVYQKYVDGQISVGFDKTEINLVVIVLMMLLKQNCSSPNSTLNTLRNRMLPRLSDNEDKQICLELINYGEKIDVPTKAIELLKIIKKSNSQVIVYSEYLATIELLKDVFKSNGITYTTYQGSLSSGEKQRAVERFRNGECQVFLSTESGGQGLNLQFCHRLINYDLPWNPMRIEQRIGRVHRFGQVNDVEIITLPTKGTIDEYLLYILTSKVNLFEIVIGELDTILSYMKVEDDSLEVRIGKIILDSVDSSEIEFKLRSIGDEMLQAKDELEGDIDQTTKILDHIGVGA
jgi:SNF2 family DNA or RNA helicase